MMQRSSSQRRRGDSPASCANSASSSSSSSYGATATTKRRSQRKRGSFSSATAASLARGCPSTSAPPSRPVMNAGTMRLPLPKMKSSAGGGGGGGSSSNNNSKENTLNSTHSTPTKQPSNNNNNKEEKEEEVPTILSPTPYWKVLEERGTKEPSPRTTRSATKKKKAAQERSAESASRSGAGGLFARGMQELEKLAEEEEDYKNVGHDDNVNLNPMMLHFSPPDKQFQLQSARNAKRRRDATAEKERVRMQKVRDVVNNNQGNIHGGGGMMTISGLGGGNNNIRVAKRAKRGHSTNNGNLKSTGDDDDDGSEASSQLTTTTTTIATAGPTSEEMRQIMAQSLAEHNSSRIEELVAKAASSERDATHYRDLYEELSSKYNTLQEQFKSMEGTDNELQLRTVEQQGIIQGYVTKIEMLENDKKDMVEKYTREKEEYASEKRMMESALTKMKAEHDAEMKRVLDDAALTLKETSNEKDAKYTSIKAELAVAQSKLSELTNAANDNETWESEHGTREELLGRVTELTSTVSELTQQLRVEKDMNVKHDGTIAKLESDLTEHGEVISQLETKLSSAITEDSRNMLEEGYSKEADDLQRNVDALEKERIELQEQLDEMNKEKEMIKNELDAIKVEKDELETQFSNEVNVENASLKSENAKLVEQVQTATVKYEENERQLEEMADENEQLIAKISTMESNMKQQIHEAEVRAEHDAQVLEKKLNTIKSERDAIIVKLTQAQSDITNLQANVTKLEEELKSSQQVTASLQNEKSTSDVKLTELSKQLQTLTDHLETAQATISTLETKLRSREDYCEQFETIERRLLQEKHVLNEIRRNLHNRVIQLSGNIRVFVRVRPLIESERTKNPGEGGMMQNQQQQYNWGSTNNRRQTTSGSRPSSRGSMAGGGSRPSSRGSMTATSNRSIPTQGEEMECPFHFPSITDRKTTSSSNSSGNDSAKSSPNYTSFDDLTKQTIELTEPYKDRGGLNPRRKKWKYGFDRVFNQENGQEDVWEGAEPLVQSCVDGFHVCMFAYGQTSSGKTHTMIGDAQNQGLIPRAVAKLFASKSEIEQSQGDTSVDIKVELLEIYNEEVRDLLDDNAGPDGQLIKLKLSSNEAVGNIKVNARDEKEVAGILQLAQERRCVKATKSNAESSRSHLLFTIHFDVSSTSGCVNRSGCLHIVDLAGSERLDKSGSHGALLTEAKHINTSLSALALVIEKLQAKKSESEHIPYRDSKLTYLLRNSLGGDSKTLAIVCCSPHRSHFNESLNSIRFAAKASKVELKDGNKVDV